MKVRTIASFVFVSCIFSLGCASRAAHTPQTDNWVTLRSGQNQLPINPTDLCTTNPEGVRGRVITEIAWRAFEVGIYRVVLYDGPIVFDDERRPHGNIRRICLLEVNALDSLTGTANVVVYSADAQPIAQVNVSTYRFDPENGWMPGAFEGRVESSVDGRQVLSRQFCTDHRCWYY